MPTSQELLCATADQQFLIYSPKESDGILGLVLTKRLVGYNEEIADMKFLGEDEKFLAVATSVEQVRFSNEFLDLNSFKLCHAALPVHSPCFQSRVHVC